MSHRARIISSYMVFSLQFCVATVAQKCPSPKPTCDVCNHAKCELGGDPKEWSWSCVADPTETACMTADECYQGKCEVDAGGIGYCSAATPTVPGAPGAISGPHSTATGSFVLSWGASTCVVDRYVLYQNGTQIFAGTKQRRSTNITILNDGVYNYHVQACNSAGCSRSTSDFVVTAALNKAATTTTLATSANPATLGGPVTLTANVTSAGGTPSGTITFLDGATSIGNESLNGVGAATLVFSTLRAGAHGISASYSGDSKFDASTSATIAEIEAPPAGIPIVETVHIPAITGATGLAGTDRVTSVSYGNVFFVQPADSFELRLRAPWPTELQVLINGQQLQEVTAGGPTPQPDDSGYFTVTASPMPGWPDKAALQSPGYNWFFILVNVKLPKTFRFLDANKSLDGFKVTLRDISLDSSKGFQDLNLSMLGYPPAPPWANWCQPIVACPPPPPPSPPGHGVPTPPSVYFYSGENSKDDTTFPYRTRASLGTLAFDVTLAGWITPVSDNLTRSDVNNGPPRSEDWHFDLDLDPDFIQRNYASNPNTLASAIIPGQPEHQVNLGGCHLIPLTGGQTLDVGTFLMPGLGNMSVELNAWHRSSRGEPDAGWFYDPDPGRNYPDNAWAFDPQRGTNFLTNSPPVQHNYLSAGDYVIVSGTLWQDIAHITGGTLPLNQCFEDALACQGGWLEIHPVDVVRYVYPPPPLHKQTEVFTACAYPGQSSAALGSYTPDCPTTHSSGTTADCPQLDNYSVLNFQEITDQRFTSPSSLLQKSIAIDSCDPTKLDVSLNVGGGSSFGEYKSAVVVWWEKSATPRPQPTCSPTRTYPFIAIGVGTGKDNLRGDSSASISLLAPDQTPVQSPITLKSKGDTEWANGSAEGQTFQLDLPQQVSAFGSFALNLIQGGTFPETDDNWNVQSIDIKLFNTSNGQKSGSVIDSTCLLRTSGDPNTGDPLTRLTGDQPSFTFPAFVGCPPTPPPQFSLAAGAYACPQTVTLTDDDPTATFFYSTDGSIPTINSKTYSGPLTVSNTEKLRAIAVGSHTGPSSTVMMTYSCLHQLTVNLRVLPYVDPGHFDLQVDGITEATNVGNGGSTGPHTLSVGNHIVSETPVPGTNLANYKVIIGGDCALNGTISLGQGDEVCTITNLGPPRLTVDDLVTPEKDTGQFILLVDGQKVTSRMQEVSVGTHAVTEIAGPHTAIADYIVSVSGDCVQTGSSATNASLTVAAGDYKTCIFGNVRKSTTCGSNSKLCCDADNKCRCISKSEQCQ